MWVLCHLASYYISTPTKSVTSSVATKSLNHFGGYRTLGGLVEITNSGSVGHQLSVISMHNQLSMDQKWCIFKQTHLSLRILP